VNPPFSIELQPLGKELAVAPGAALRDVLFAHGVEFPCGGRGRCKGCRIKVLDGALPVTADDARLLSPTELTEGWRLACAANVSGDLKIEVAQWDAPILCDDSPFEFTPQPGLGIAVDLGTTTIAAQLLDLQTARVLAIRTALNPQARHGGDIMSRIDFAANGACTLKQLVRAQIRSLVDELLAAAHRAPWDLTRVVLVGNTVMHHLFCGLDITPLSHSPFEPADDGLKTFRGADLGWPCRDTPVHFLPCLGGFVGSDILAGILATRLGDGNALRVLVDLGTNGEIVVGNRERLLCASTAAGPAFEGARISAGMRAMTGAIAEARVEHGEIICRVLGNTEARGICGSGLVDVVVAGLDTRQIEPTGRMRAPLRLAPRVEMNQCDVRELQLAKGAIAAGIVLLLKRWGAEATDVFRVYLAGAFGNYINRTNARRIGLIDFPLERVEAAGNTALLGAKLALFAADLSFPELTNRVEHFSLADDPEFQDVFVDSLRLGERTCETQPVLSRCRGSE